MSVYFIRPRFNFGAVASEDNDFSSFSDDYEECRGNSYNVFVGFEFE